MLTSEPSTELSPLDVILLDALLEGRFCDRDFYLPEVCDLTCTICKDLLIQEGGHA